MRSGKEIVGLQDTEPYLQMLRAQRQLYSEAKMLKAIAAVLCLGLPVLITVLQVLAPNQCITSASVCFVVELFVFVCGLVILAVANRKIMVAASVQQRFDLMLYGLGAYNCPGLETSIIEASKRYEDSDDNDGTLKEWYSKEIASLDKIEAIRCCQKTNIKWSFRLGCLWMVLLILISVVCVAIVVVPTLGFGVDWANLFFGTTIIEWATLQIYNGLSYLLYVRDLDKTTELLVVDSEESIRRLQDLIFDYRKSGFKVPNWLFRVVRPRYAMIGDTLAEAENL